MGLGSNEDDNVVVDDGDGDFGDCNNGGNSFCSVSCSICLELVADNGDRSRAQLQCGHQFHLDCIGSAFNIKGAMQCPNCRKIEKGQWLYANGCRSFPELSMEDWTHYEDLYDLNYSEMSFGVHWCPFGSLTRLPSSFEEGEFSSNAYHDLQGPHAIFAERTAISSAIHPCPYFSYFGPIHPSSSNTSGSVSDNSNFNNPWNGPSVDSEMSTSYTFPATDLHYRSWEQHSFPFSTSSSRIGSSDQTSILPVTQRLARTSSDMPRSGSFVHPFLGHSARAGSSVASSMIPPYPGSNALARDSVQTLQAYYQRQQPGNPPAMHTPIPSARRSGSQRGTGQVGPVSLSSDQNSGFYFFPPDLSGRNFQEAENPPPSRFQAWERDHSTPFTFDQVDRDSRWGAFRQAANDSDPGLRPSILRSERTLQQNQS